MLSPIYRLGLYIFFFFAFRLDAPCTISYIYAMFKISLVLLRYPLRREHLECKSGPRIYGVLVSFGRSAEKRLAGRPSVL